MASEEAKVIQAEQDDSLLVVFNRIPYALINQETDMTTQDLMDELTQIARYYKIYKRGANFTVEGSNGDYVPANLRYRMAASLVDKEARFLFAEAPDVTVKLKGDASAATDGSRKVLDTINTLVKAVLDANKFEDAILRAAKDCFIGKRVAGVVNFNEEDGVTVAFLPSTQFVYETKIGNPNVLTKFVCYIIVRDSANQTDKRIFKKKYVLEDDGLVYVEEIMYSGAGTELEVVTEYQATKLSVIPACVFINDGLTGEDKGESEIESLREYESWYSKLSNADLDAERKSMNPTKYVVDMNPASTKRLSTAAGALWDLGTDQNLENPYPEVGILEPAMNYSNALATSLDRIKTIGYGQVDVPDITNDSLKGMITSGKALKAIYWPLIVRCKEKMKMWGPQLRALIDIVIQGAMLYPNCVTKYIDESLTPIDYEVSIVQNIPIPEDEVEEKGMDLQEVAAQTMSRKSYMIKWRGLTDSEADKELQQIAMEREILEDSFMPQQSSAFGMPSSDGGSEDDEVV